METTVDHSGVERPASGLGRLLRFFGAVLLAPFRFLWWVLTSIEWTSRSGDDYLRVQASKQH